MSNTHPATVKSSLGRGEGGELWFMVGAYDRRHAEGAWSGDAPTTPCCAGGRGKSARAQKGSEQREQEFTHLFFPFQGPQLL